MQQLSMSYFYELFLETTNRFFGFFIFIFQTAEKSGHIERSKNVRQRQNDFKVS